jgi:hypothetical protein
MIRSGSTCPFIRHPDLAEARPAPRTRCAAPYIPSTERRITAPLLAVLRLVMPPPRLDPRFVRGSSSHRLDCRVRPLLDQGAVSASSCPDALVPGVRPWRPISPPRQATLVARPCSRIIRPSCSRTLGLALLDVLSEDRRAKLLQLVPAGYTVPLIARLTFRRSMFSSRAIPRWLVPPWYLARTTSW